MGRKPKAANFEAMSEKSNTPTELERSEPEAHKTSASLPVSEKASKIKSMIVRRSGRIQNLVKPTRGQEIETFIEPINLVESEKEDELCLDESQSQSEDVPLANETTTEPTLRKRTLEEKIEQLVEDVEELKSKEGIFSEGPSSELNYKSLYIQVKKKNEALTKELQIARAKLEAYENVMGKWKDVSLVSNLTKVTEAVVNLSSKVMYSFPSTSSEPEPTVVTEPPAKKKRRNYKGSK